jgi:hypothetical protein
VTRSHRQSGESQLPAFELLGLVLAKHHHTLCSLSTSSTPETSRTRSCGTAMHGIRGISKEGIYGCDTCRSFPSSFTMAKVSSSQ